MLYDFDKRLTTHKPEFALPFTPSGAKNAYGRLFRQGYKGLSATNGLPMEETVAVREIEGEMKGDPPEFLGYYEMSIEQKKAFDTRQGIMPGDREKIDQVGSQKM